MVVDSGMMVMGELHQGKVLSMTGRKLQSETIFIGSPTIGKDLFSAQPGVGLVVPIRVNVYADAQGQTVVNYAPPSEQLSAVHDSKVDTIATMLDDTAWRYAGRLASSSVASSVWCGATSSATAGCWRHARSWRGFSN